MNTLSPLNLTAVGTVAYNSNTVSSYLIEQELVQYGWKSFSCYSFLKFPWKVCLGKLSIIAKIAERIILPNSGPTSPCHRCCFWKDWYLHSESGVCSCLWVSADPHLSQKERSDSSPPSRDCAESCPSGTEDGFLNGAHILYQLWICW